MVAGLVSSLSVLMSSALSMSSCCCRPCGHRRRVDVAPSSSAVGPACLGGIMRWYRGGSCVSGWHDVGVRFSRGGVMPVVKVDLRVAKEGSHGLECGRVVAVTTTGLRCERSDRVARVATRQVRVSPLL
ncbi:hypothetical protein EDB83DRAFT_2461271, partial [Lactarius deliciosus]